MENKRGWIKILEAFFAVLLILAIVISVINLRGVFVNGKETRVYDIQARFVRGIQLNSTLRSEILLIDEGLLPLQSSSEDFPQEIRESLSGSTLEYLECEAQLCLVGNDCRLEIDTEKSIYSRDYFIFADKENYSPRKLKLFCWIK